MGYTRVVVPLWIQMLAEKGPNPHGWIHGVDLDAQFFVDL